VGFKKSIQTYAIAQAISYLVKDADRKGLIKEIVENIEEVSRKNLGAYSDKTQIEIVEKVIIPLARELMKDTRESRLAYHAAIAKAFTESDQSLRRDYPK